MFRVGFKIQEKLVLNSPVHDGTLRNSILFTVEDNGDVVFSMVNYAKWVEFGSKPHWTSIENLKKWARDKLGDEDAAYALQRHIAKNGTKPHPFIRVTFLESLKEAIIEAIAEESGNYVNL